MYLRLFFCTYLHSWYISAMPQKFYLACCVLLLGLCPAMAVAIDEDSPLSAPLDLQGEWQELVVPLKRAGGLFLIEVQIDSVVGDFLLDTGAPYVVLNATYFRSYATGAQQPAVGVNGDVSSQTTTGVVNRLQLNKAFCENVQVDIQSLAQIEDAKGVRIMGLLGANVFSNLWMRIDTRTNQLVVRKSGEFPALNALDSLLSRQLPDIEIPFKYCDDRIFIPITIEGKKMNWMLDTGAESNVLDSWNNKKVMKEFVVTRRINLTGSTGEKQDVLLGFIEQMKVGEVAFTTQQAIVTSMRELSETCSVFIDGVVGYPFLSQGIYELDFSKKIFRMYLYNNLKL
jgi:predicted aspartyl protease